MSGLWSRTLVYLGLREEDDELYYESHQDVVDERGGVDPRDPYEAFDRHGDAGSRDGLPADPDTGRRRSRREAREDRWEDPEPRRADREPDGRRSRFAERDDQVHDSGRIAAIGSDNVRRLRPEEPSARASVPTTVKVVHVTTFEDCEVIGMRFRTNQPVLFDVRGAERRVARRVLDFVSGMTFVAYGSLKRIGEVSYLLVPDGVSIPADERRRLSDLGYDLSGVPSR